MSGFDTSPTCGDNATAYLVVGALHTASAGVSLLCSAVVVALIVLFKKYRFFEQRLVLYLSTASFLYSLVTSVVKIDYLGASTEKYCRWMGFLSQCTQYCLLIAVLVIAVDILLRVRRGRVTRGLEPAYVIFIFIFPASFNWVPFMYDAYGMAGSWCWIVDRKINESGDCVKYTTGTILQFSLWYGPLFFVLLTLIIAYIVIIIQLQQQKMNWSGVYNPEEEHHRKQMRREIWRIFWYPVIYMFLNIFPLLNRLYNAFASNGVLALWILHAVLSPLQGGFIALVYAMDPDTRTKLNCSSILFAFREWFCSEDDRIKEYVATIDPDPSSYLQEQSKPLLDDEPQNDSSPKYRIIYPDHPDP